MMILEFMMMTKKLLLWTMETSREMFLKAVTFGSLTSIPPDVVTVMIQLQYGEGKVYNNIQLKIH